jgi:hypothetical protein
MEDYKKNLIKIEVHCNKWLDNLKTANESAQEIVNIRDITKWRLNAINEHPNPQKALLTMQSDDIEDEYKNLYETVPMIPGYKGVTAVSSSFATAGTSGYMGHLVSLEKNGSYQESTYAKKYIKSYGDLQNKQERYQKVCALIQELEWVSVENCLKRTHSEYYQFKAGIGERTAVANEIRTLLYKFKGELFYKALNYPKEKITKWYIMASRLAAGNPNAENILMKQEKVYNALNDDLSFVLKDRGENREIDIDAEWYNVLDHIYTILQLITNAKV